MHKNNSSNILVGKLTRLRAIEPNDVDLIYEWENNSSIWQLSNTITPFSKHIINQFIENSHQDIFKLKQLRLMIEKTNEKELQTIGTIDLFDFDPMHKRAGIGILITNIQDRKSGYASDALDILIKYSFQTLQLNQLYCNITENNTDSIKLFQSKGFKLIGTKKDWLIYPSGTKDELMFQLIRD
ncbi:MAG: GNAT family protein [Bacteroidales bacterium]|jgi:diamine N-acetyltransferase|nr:GNAT family protein [Bacteroidales bacterium]